MTAFIFGGGRELSGGVHEALGFNVVFAAAAFNHVAGEGEGGADEADDAELVSVGAGWGEVFGYELDGAGDVLEVFGAVCAELGDLVVGADGGVDMGALAGYEFKVQAHGGEGEEKVGKDDGGVDGEALGGGDGNFCGDGGGAADFQQGVMLADGHIFRHVSAGLTEEPYGGAVNGLAEAGSYETAGVHRVKGSIWGGPKVKRLRDRRMTADRAGGVA